jgi:outer membrane lipopolysaccharide assembly protein LptE/RlpB
LTGTGKTTLVNYLNGVQLQCLRDRVSRKWILEIASNSSSLPCGFKIGHGTVSETIFPAVYTAPGEDFSYVDNPGFQDNRGISNEIANNFFRNLVTEAASEFKFLLLLTHQDLQLRGQQFRDTIKRFSEILGIFNSTSVNTLSKSVAIIITRVENDDDDTDDEMKTFLRSELLRILKEQKNSISENEEKVFSQIINDKQVDIFSNPKKTGIVSDTQSIQIKSLIDSMIYLNKDDAKFRVTIPPDYRDQLFDYIEDRYSKFKKTVESILHKNISEFVKNEISKAIVVEDFKNIESTLRDVISKGSHEVNLEIFFDTMNENILDTVSKETLNKQMKLIEFFIQLLPDSMVSHFSSDKNYLNEFNLDSALMDQLKILTNLSQLLDYIEDRYSEFKKTVESTLHKNISEYVKNEIIKAIVVEEVKNIENMMIHMISIGSQKVNLKTFIKTMNENILDTVSKETLKNQMKSIEVHIQQLPVNMISHFSGDKNYFVEFNLETALKDQINFLTNMYKLEIDIENSVMEIKGCFIKSSEIIKAIKISCKVSSIVVYSCQAVHFDMSLDLQNLKNLTIISPKWNVEKQVNIDLSGSSGSSIPIHAKANPGSIPGASGANGLPGGAGKNGGRFYGFVNTFSNLGRILLITLYRIIF